MLAVGISALADPATNVATVAWMIHGVESLDVLDDVVLGPGVPAYLRTRGFVNEIGSKFMLV